MDLQKQFKDLDLGENLEMDVAKIEQKLNEENLPESREDFDEGEKMVKELEARLKQLAGNERRENVEEYEDLEQETFLEKMQPFILPICLTLFAIVFAGLFLYFFSKSRVETVQQAIINNGVPEQVNYPPQPVPVIVKEEPLVCTEPQILNDTGDACIDPEPVATTTVPVKVAFEDGTTTEAHVRFSFDKYNYDNSPRGIFLLDTQIFDGNFEDYKLNPTNRAYANDYFFGVDRYTVSLIGSCSYVVDDARILVKNMSLKNNYFIGNVVKVIEASKPRVVCQE